MLQVATKNLNQNAFYGLLGSQSFLIFTFSLTGIAILKYLWFNLFFLYTVCIQPSYIQLTIKMSNVANNGVFQHLFEHISMNNGCTACGSYKYSGFLQTLIYCCDFEA